MRRIEGAPTKSVDAEAIPYTRSTTPYLALKMCSNACPVKRGAYWLLFNTGRTGTYREDRSASVLSSSYSGLRTLLLHSRSLAQMPCKHNPRVRWEVAWVEGHVLETSFNALSNFLHFAVSWRADKPPTIGMLLLSGSGNKPGHPYFISALSGITAQVNIVVETMECAVSHHSGPNFRP